MAGVQRCCVEMSAPVFRSATKEDQDAVRALIFAILHEYDLEPAPKTTDKDLDDIEGFYDGGAFDVLVLEEDEIIGTVGLKPEDGGVFELRKMYLKENYRGRGYGARLLKHAIARAKELGGVRIELETARVLKEAIGLYEKFGFVLVEGRRTEKRCDQVLTLDL